MQDDRTSRFERDNETLQILRSSRRPGQLLGCTRNETGSSQKEIVSVVTSNDASEA